MPKFEVPVKATFVTEIMPKLGVEHNVNEVRTVTARSKGSALNKVKKDIEEFDMWHVDPDRRHIKMLIVGPARLKKENNDAKV
tara:strand:- start:276 stop:524 length:249 start_codon:yes stop_codon:yes gene_type:complete